MLLHDDNPCVKESTFIVFVLKENIFVPLFLFFKYYFARNI